MYTLNDIAKALGVNKATVSKAISGKGKLSQETRERILAYIEACGYRPNAAAQSLARNRTNNIGLILPQDRTQAAFFRDCLDGVCRAAEAENYDVLLAMGGDRSVEPIARLIDQRKIDGVIAMRNLADSPVVGFLKEAKVPFVLIGSTPQEDVLWVDADNRSACRELTARLIAMGIRSMALLGGDESNYVTQSRLAGFSEACAAAGLPAQPVWLNAAGRLEEIMAGLDAQCIVCMDDYLCNLVMSRLRAEGIRVPQDKKVVSFYDSVLLEQSVPSVTSLRFDAAQLGELAGKLLIDQLEGRPVVRPPMTGYELFLRQSTAENVE